jgi:peptidyl-prolyl cis-trans isomerase SurA
MKNNKEEFILTLSPKYIPNWHKWEAFREIMQNVIDRHREYDRAEIIYEYNANKQRIIIGNKLSSLDKKTLDEYVDLFINFKLKVEEAKAQGIDTTKSFVNELAGYRSQLTKPYLTDSKVDEQIIKEAYERMKEDVEVSHILIRVAASASPTDTLAAWKRICIKN